jgi:hypothetical protein
VERIALQTMQNSLDAHVPQFPDIRLFMDLKLCIALHAQLTPTPLTDKIFFVELRCFLSFRRHNK